MATLDLSKRPSQRFFEVGNGKVTPEIASTGDFYTAWARSGRPVGVRNANYLHIQP